jgi:hypothetical protein
MMKVTLGHILSVWHVPLSECLTGLLSLQAANLLAVQSAAAACYAVLLRAWQQQLAQDEST